MLHIKFEKKIIIGALVIRELKNIHLLTYGEHILKNSYMWILINIFWKIVVGLQILFILFQGLIYLRCTF
jgi:hypothetical protein